MNWYMIKTKDTYVSKWYIFYFFIFLILLLFLEKLIFEFLKFFFYFFQFLIIFWGQTKLRGVMPLYGIRSDPVVGSDQFYAPQKPVALWRSHIWVDPAHFPYRGITPRIFVWPQKIFKNWKK
jgi:hypothetical protein